MDIPHRIRQRLRAVGKAAEILIQRAGAPSPRCRQALVQGAVLRIRTRRERGAFTC